MEENFWGTSIRVLREEQRISQRTLAADTKISRSTLRKIEAGESSGDIKAIETLLSYLGYELEAIHKGMPVSRGGTYDPFSSDRRSKLAAVRVLTLSLS
jgi:transcriptional regulator with XRE-family HTH domain